MFSKLLPIYRCP